MKRTLHIEIDCGDVTCASAPGKFCPHLRVGKFGQKWMCSVFDLAEVTAPADYPEGWLRRLPQCIEMEKK